MTRREEAAGVFEGEGEGDEDDGAREEVGAEVATGEGDVAADGEGEEEKLCGAGDDCEEGAGEETAGGLDACEFTAEEGGGWEGATEGGGGGLDPLGAADTEALAWWKARRW